MISPLALEAARRIDALFEIERAINGRTAEERKPCAKLPRGNDVAKAMDT